MTTAALVGRVGGLAVALGVGAAIGTAVSAPAWAAPSDSSASTSASADAKPDGAVASRGRARASAASATRTARVEDRPNRPSATASVPRAASRVGIQAIAAAKSIPVQPNLPTPPAPVQLVAAAQAVGRDVEQRASSRAAATSARAAAVTANQNAQGFSFLNKYVIFKYIPFSFPRRPAFFVKNVTGSALFTENSVYDLQSVDQYDWNKLTGISFNFLRPDQNALMVAWRYNVKDKDFEIAPYYNVDTARILPNEQTEVIKVPIGQSFDFTVNYTGITLTYGNQTVFKKIPANLPTNQLTAFRVQPWFGGTSLPPNTLSLYMKLNSWCSSI